MAQATLNALRVGVAAAVLALFGWVGYQTIHAGEDVPPAVSRQALTRLTGGTASGKRIDGKSWSLDYDTATMSPDGSTAEIDDIRDGIIRRDGKPYMRMRARHVSANTTVNDFAVVGPVSFAEIGGAHRTLETNGAHYLGATHTLVLAHRVTIHQGGMQLVVDRATVNFASGQLTLGRIVGTL